MHLAGFIQCKRHEPFVRFSLQRRIVRRNGTVYCDILKDLGPQSAGQRAMLIGRAYLVRGKELTCSASEYGVVEEGIRP